MHVRLATAQEHSSRRRHRPEAQLQAAVVEHLRLRARPDVLAMSEQQIHRAIIWHLETRAAPNTFWFHVPNGGYRRPAEAKILKSLGVVRGTPDLCFVKDGRAYFLELKAPGRPLSPAQEEVLIKLRDCGAIATHAHGLDQALAWLQARGLLTGEVQ